VPQFRARVARPGTKKHCNGRGSRKQSRTATVVCLELAASPTPKASQTSGGRSKTPGPKAPSKYRHERVAETPPQSNRADERHFLQGVNATSYGRRKHMRRDELLLGISVQLNLAVRKQFGEPHCSPFCYVRSAYVQPHKLCQPFKMSQAGISNV
jgi:hypothetical protein